jgi:hypothetical protein
MHICKCFFALFFLIAPARADPPPDARILFTPEILQQSQDWVRSTGWTPNANNPLECGWYYAVTGDVATGLLAVDAAFNFDIGDEDLQDCYVFDTYRWFDYVEIIPDWCRDLMEADARWPAWRDRMQLIVYTIREREGGGVSDLVSNYYTGYLRNEIHWSIAADDPNLLAWVFANRIAHERLWQADGGLGGAGPEGSQYGVYQYGYRAIPLLTLENLRHRVLTDTNWFIEAVYWIDYWTLDDGSLWPMADEEFGGASDRDNHLANFMALMALKFDGSTVGNVARNWLQRTGNEPSFFMRPLLSAGSGGSVSLPEDYYAAGEGYFRIGRGATQILLQLKRGESGHSQLDAGTFQINRNGTWLSRESWGYETQFSDCNSTSTLAHNGITVNYDDESLRPRDRGTVLRLQSAGEFAYAAVDLTQTYRSDRAYYDNAEVASVVREFLYIRNLEALAICDHVETVSPDTPRRFSLHGTNAPQVSGLTALFQAGCQELKFTCFLSGATSSSSTVVNEGPDGQQRLDISAAGSAAITFLSVLQCRDAGTADLTIERNGNSLTINGVVIDFDARTFNGQNLRSDVQQMTITRDGASWQ